MASRSAWVSMSTRMRLTHRRTDRIHSAGARQAGADQCIAFRAAHHGQELIRTAGVRRRAPQAGHLHKAFAFEQAEAGHVGRPGGCGGQYTDPRRHSRTKAPKIPPVSGLGPVPPASTPGKPAAAGPGGTKQAGKNTHGGWFVDTGSFHGVPWVDAVSPWLVLSPLEPEENRLRQRSSQQSQA